MAASMLNTTVAAYLCAAGITLYRAGVLRDPTYLAPCCGSGLWHERTFLTLQRRVLAALLRPSGVAYDRI